MTPAELWDELVACNPDEREKRLQVLLDAKEAVETAAAAKPRQARRAS